MDSVPLYLDKTNKLVNDVYEQLLKGLQKNNGEFFTGRALTNLAVSHVKPQLGDKIADFACGTGGFLVSALKHLTAKVQTPEDLQLCRNNLFGIEKKSFPYSLCMTNLILHEVDEPKIYQDNSLNKNVRELKENDMFDVILMNPPYGGTEDEIIQMNFPQEFRACKEVMDLAKKNNIDVDNYLGKEELIKSNGEDETEYLKLLFNLSAANLISFSAFISIHSVLQNGFLPVWGFPGPKSNAR